VIANQQTKKTKVIKKALNPVWNETLSFSGKGVLKLDFECFDWDFIGKDLIGKFSLPIAALPLGETKITETLLQKDGQQGGKLNLIITKNK